MVLTLEEVSLSRSSLDGRIKSAWTARQTVQDLVAQCCCDREIQRYLDHKATPAYKFNCNVIHQAWKFAKVYQQA